MKFLPRLAPVNSSPDPPILETTSLPQKGAFKYKNSRCLRALLLFINHLAWSDYFAHFLEPEPIYLWELRFYIPANILSTAADGYVDKDATPLAN